MTRRIFFKVLLVVVAVFSLLTLSGILLAQGSSEDAFDRVREVQERHTDRLMAIEGVEGTAVGLDENDRPVVKVFTARPAVAGIPRTLEGVPVQVEVTGEFYALPKPGTPTTMSGSDDPTDWWPRPVPIGVSTGHPKVTAGTIGCRVTDRTYVYALSNNHIYANSNLAKIGDNVLQPGPYDGGVNPVDAIGTLYAFQKIVFSRTANNTIDAAIAKAIYDAGVPRVGISTPPLGYGTPKSTTVGAYVDQKVQKYGRTTRLTNGTVYAVNATVLVYYSRGIARFVKQIIITPGSFSAGGDSGSLIVTDPGKNPVGLLFAGSSTMTVANPIDLVLSRFGVTIDGE